MSDYSIVSPQVTLQNLLVTWVDTSSSNDTGGLAASLYSNGVMKSAIFIKYSYFYPPVAPREAGESPSEEEINGIDEAMQNYFIESDDAYLFELSNSNIPIGGEGSPWKVNLENNKFRNDISLNISARPSPSYNTAATSINGWIRVFVTPPAKSLGALKLKVYGAYTDTQVSNVIDLNCSEPLLSKDSLVIEYIDQIRKNDENYTRLHALKYSTGSGLPDSVKLLGIEDKGKYGLTLSAPGLDQCNINISYMLDDDCKIAGFFDEQLSEKAPNDPAFKLILGMNKKSLTGTDFKGPDDAEQGQNNIGMFWCNDGNWTSPESLLATSVANAFANGIPMIACHKDGGYKIKLNNEDGKLFTINYANKQQYAYDNCGNRVTFEIDYHVTGWNSDWDAGKWPIELTAGYYSGGCEE